MSTTLRFFAKEAPKFNGLSLAIERGWGNGYVCIPEGHPLHGLSYDDIHRLYEIDVNGGLTFAEKGSACRSDKWVSPDFVNDNDWVVGFDTAHYGDTIEQWPDETSVLKEAERLAEQIDAIRSKKQTVEEERQELLTRLHNLVNEFDDNYTEGSYRHTIMNEARELIKKLTP